MTAGREELGRTSEGREGREGEGCCCSDGDCTDYFGGGSEASCSGGSSGGSTVGEGAGAGRGTAEVLAAMAGLTAVLGEEEGQGGEKLSQQEAIAQIAKTALALEEELL